MAKIDALPSRAGRFLDFGCGVGRVSQALSAHFTSGLGVDISARMIELAKTYIEKGQSIEFIKNSANDLHFIPALSISFIYAHIVLQHISSELQRRFIQEFTRILEPGGVAVFQIPIEDLGFNRPTEQSSWAKRQIPRPLKDGLKKLLGMKTEDDIVTMEMNTLSDLEITPLIQTGGCYLIQLCFSNSTEPDHDGRIDFFDRADALARVADGRARSKLLSGFYFIRKNYSRN